MHDPSGLPERVLELEAAVAARHDPDVAAGIAEYLAERIAVTQGDLDGLVADPETVAWVIWAVSSAFGVSDLTGIRVPDPDRVKQLMRPWVVGR